MTETPLQRIDLFILDGIFQRVSDWTTDNFGADCFTLAKGCFVLSAVADCFRGAHGFGFFMLMAANAGCLLGCIGVEHRTRKTPTTMNEERQRYFWRLVAVAFAATDVPVIIHDSKVAALFSWGGFIAALYFSACTPRPPKPKEQRALVTEGVSN